MLKAIDSSPSHNEEESGMFVGRKTDLPGKHNLPVIML
jgi:hypothetical protein